MLSDYVIINNDQVMQRKGSRLFPHTMFKHIRLTQDGNSVSVEIKDWEGNSLPFEPITCLVNCEEIICDDGILELEGVAGTEVSIITTMAMVENAELQVILI